MDFTNGSKTDKRMLVSFLLDRTGSMQQGKEETIKGFNSYLDEFGNANLGEVGLSEAGNGGGANVTVNE